MTDKSQHILCAVRGGPENREMVTHAVSLALDSSARLTFFRVMDAEFLIPCDRARRRGVAQVDYAVRQGNIRKQLLQFALEAYAGLMVIGRPTRSPRSNVFKPAEFDAFFGQPAGPESSFSLVDLDRLAAPIKADTGIETHIV